MLPPWKRYPNTVAVKNKAGADLVASLACSLWFENGAQLDMMGLPRLATENLTMQSGYNANVQEGNFIEWDPTSDGLVGPAQLFHIEHVDDERQRHFNLVCSLKKVARNVP